MMWFPYHEDLTGDELKGLIKTVSNHSDLERIKFVWPGDWQGWISASVSGRNNICLDWMTVKNKDLEDTMFQLLVNAEKLQQAFSEMYQQEVSNE